MSNSAINPDFKLSSFINREALTEDEILGILEDNYNIFREMNRFGIIHSQKFSFIDKATFSETDKNCVEKKMNLKEKKH